MSKNKHFSDTWLTYAELSNWLSRAPANSQAHCELFKTNFTLGNMGVKALNSQFQKHLKSPKEQSEIAGLFVQRER